MSFINLEGDITKIKDPETVPEGMYDLAVTKIMEKQDGQGSLTGVNLIIDIVGNIDAADVFHHISLPVEGDDEEKANFKLRFLKKFLEQFDIPFDKKGFDLANLMGAQGKCKLGLNEYQGQISNKIIL